MPTVLSSNVVSDLSPEPGVTSAYYSRKLLERALYRNYHARWAESVPLPSREGRTVVMRRWLHLAMALSPLTESQPPAGKTPTLDDYQATLVQHGDFIALSDMAEWTSKDPVLNHFTMLLGEQEGYSNDAVDRDTAVSGTNVVYSNGTARNQVTEIVDFNDLDRLIRVLEDAGAETLLSGTDGSKNYAQFPTRPAYAAIVAPSVIFDISNIQGYKDASEYHGAAEGEEGRYKNIAFFCAPDVSSLGAGAKKFAGAGGTSSLVKNTAGVADVFTILLFGKNAFTKVPLNAKSSSFISKPIGSSGAADPLDQIGTLGWKTTGARLRTNENWMARCECAVSL